MPTGWIRGILAMLVALSATAVAHPGRGIVVNADGVVYVSDAVRSVVWRFEANGRVSAAARDVHAHWLALDADGSVFADHARYEAGDRRFHRGLVRIDRAGGVSTLIEPRPDPEGLDGGSFAVVPDGLAIARDSTPVIDVRRADGSRRSLAALPPARAPIDSLIADAAGVLFAVRGDSVLKIDAGGHSVVVLHELPPLDGDGVLNLRVRWGLARDDSGRLYTTEPGRRRTIVIDDHGRHADVVQSEAPWFPTGVAARGHRLWVLEHGLIDQRNLGPRVRVRDAEGRWAVLGEVSD